MKRIGIFSLLCETEESQKSEWLYLDIFRKKPRLISSKTGELMVTPPKYLNDPLECRPVIRCKNPREFARRKIEELMTPESFEKLKHVLSVRTFGVNEML